MQHSGSEFIREQWARIPLRVRVIAGVFIAAVAIAWAIGMNSGSTQAKELNTEALEARQAVKDAQRAEQDAIEAKETADLATEDANAATEAAEAEADKLKGQIERVEAGEKVPATDDAPVIEPATAPVEEPTKTAPASGSPLAVGDLDCGDFGSWAEAQDYLDDMDSHGLDADGDGEACDSLK